MEFPFWHNQLFQFMLCTFMLFILPQLHPNGTYTSYEISISEELVGPYAENSLINNAEHLHLGLLKGPETLVVLNNVLYTGIHGGDVVRIVDTNIQPVTKFGVDCDGQWQESKCGRPFGLATDNIENLFVADAYYGIWQYNVKTGSRQVLVPHNVSIDGRVPKIFNSLAVSRSGDVYWTDSSADVDIQNGVFAMFMDGSGRLFKYDAEKNQSYVLADELYFPNGIVLSPKEDFVVVSEMITSRLLRYYISGPKKGITEVFLDKIPGFPDRLKVHGNYITVALVHARDASEPVFFQRISSYSLVRRLIVHTMAYAENVFKFLNRFLPTEMFEKIIHKIGHFETVAGFAPKRVTILIVDWDGNVVESWHNTDGTLTAVGDVQIFKGHVYYGSPYNMYIGRTPMPKTNLTFENQRPKSKTIVLEI